MAARLELYGVVDGHHLEHYEDDVLAAAEQAAGIATAAQPAFLAYVSADDDDEQLLYDVLSVVAEHTGLDARTQGRGLVDADDQADTVARLADAGTLLPPLELTGEQEKTAREWLDALATGAARAGDAGTQLGWRMHYDRAGSVDDGPDEFPTSHS